MLSAARALGRGGSVRGRRRPRLDPRRGRARAEVQPRRAPRRAAGGVRSRRAVRPARRQPAVRPADRRAARALEHDATWSRSARARRTSSNRYEYHLDFPGSALEPGLRLRALAATTSPRAAGRPRSTRTSRPTPRIPGKLALQYWFFYVFNDFNNTHEGDWEMIQLDFDAADAAEALDAGADRGRLQLARGRRAGGLGRRQARARRRHASGRLPGRGPPREQVRRRRSTSAARRTRGSAATTRSGRTTSSGRS